MGEPGKEDRPGSIRFFNVEADSDQVFEGTLPHGIQELTVHFEG